MAPRSTTDALPGDLVLAARALLLDMDGTLVDSDAVVERVWRDWAAEHGFDAADVLRVTHGRQPHASMALLVPGRAAAENQADERRFLARELAEVDGVLAVPGALALLVALRDLGLPHALVTSASEALARVRMAAAGLPLPPVLVTSDRVTASKPDPEGFVVAAAELGHSPADCIAFEDSPAGITAGIAAGMRVVGVGPRAAGSATVARVDSLDQVRLEATPGGLVLRVAITGRP